jgi:hypothetical protein
MELVDYEDDDVETFISNNRIPVTLVIDNCAMKGELLYGYTNRYL